MGYWTNKKSIGGIELVRLVRLVGLVRLPSAPLNGAVARGLGWR